METVSRFSELSVSDTHCSSTPYVNHSRCNVLRRSLDASHVTKISTSHQVQSSSIPHRTSAGSWTCLSRFFDGTGTDSSEKFSSQEDVDEFSSRVNGEESVGLPFSLNWNDIHSRDNQILTHDDTHGRPKDIDIIRCTLPNYMSGSVAYNKITDNNEKYYDGNMESKRQISILNDYRFNDETSMDQLQSESVDYLKLPDQTNSLLKPNHEGAMNLSNEHNLKRREEVEYLGTYETDKILTPPPRYVGKNSRDFHLELPTKPPPPYNPISFSSIRRLSPNRQGIEHTSRFKYKDAVMFPSPPGYHEAVAALRKNSQSLPKISHDSKLFSIVASGKHYKSASHLPSYADHMRERTSQKHTPVDKTTPCSELDSSALQKSMMKSNQEFANSSLIVCERVNDAPRRRRVCKDLRHRSYDDIRRGKSIDFITEESYNIPNGNGDKLIKGRSLDITIQREVNDQQHDSPITIKYQQKYFAADAEHSACASSTTHKSR